MPPSAMLLRHRLALPPRLRLIRVRPKSITRSDGRARTVKYIILFIEDVLFCLLCAVALSLLLYRTNDGQFRLSAVVALLCGVALYLMTLGRLVHLFSGVIVVAVRALILWSLAVIAYPMVALTRLLGKWTAPLRHRIKGHVLKKWHASKQKQLLRKQARMARTTYKKRSKDDIPALMPSNGPRYFAFGRHRAGE